MSILKSPLSLFSDMKEKFTQSGKPEPVAEVESFLELMEPIHKMYAKQWFLNIAYYMGQQYLQWDKRSGRFSTPLAPSWRVRMVVNKILPLARVQIAKIQESDMNFYAIPSTQDDNDVSAAKTASKVLKNIYHSEEFESVKDELIGWQVLTGNAFIIPLYDPHLGKELILDETDPITGEITTRTINTGDIVHDVVSPFELIPDFSTSRWSEMSAVVRKKIRSVEYLKSEYGASLPIKEEAIPQDMLNSLKIANLVDAEGTQSDIAKSMKKTCITKEMWRLPTQEFPKGRHILVAGSVVLFEEPLDAKLNGRQVLPVTHIPAIRIPGKLLAMSSVENALPLQSKYNRLRSIMMEHSNLISGPKLVAAVGSLEGNTYDDRPLGVISYRPEAGGSAPFFATPGPLASYILDSLRLVVTEIEDVFGVHDISQ